MVFSVSGAETLPHSSISLPPVPDELRLVSVLGLKQGAADGFRQARIVEADTQVVARVLAVRTLAVLAVTGGVRRRRFLRPNSLSSVTYALPEPWRR